MARSAEFRPEPLDNERLANLCGALDQNLRRLEEAFDVRIARRGDTFSVEGPPNATRDALAALAHFHALAARPITLDDLQLGVVELRAAQRAPAGASDESPVLHTRRTDLQGRTPNQRDYLRKILGHDITFAIGPAGTGKTYLAVACAVDALERDAVKRIVLTRPAVEAGERLGFLPGDLAQKVDPYLRPLYDALYDLLGFERTAKMFEKQAIEIAPLAYMRGRTLNHSFIILDEAQNTTAEQMKMFLTRMGFGSRAVVTGDVTQIDLPRGQRSGLIDARRILREVRGVAITEFDSSDVVRHPLVARIVDAYEHDAEDVRGQ
ncbi:MAG: PhoH family protein [Burkholderiaceae bacterium]|nr:PhoH family protein [Burkholderiaceae bacterium]